MIAANIENAPNHSGNLSQYRVCPENSIICASISKII